MKERPSFSGFFSRRTTRLQSAAIRAAQEWSPVKVFGGYGAPLNVREATRAGVPIAHHHTAECHQHGCHHALQQLFTVAETARNRYAGFFGLGCDCFAF